MRNARLVAWVTLAVLALAVGAVGAATEAAQQAVAQGKPQNPGGGNGGGNGGGGDDGSTGPWPVSVMLWDGANDGIRSDGTPYADGVDGVQAFIRSGGDLQFEFHKKSARFVEYDFNQQTKAADCVVEGNCNCVAPQDMTPPYIANESGGGWVRVNALSAIDNMRPAEPGLHELAVGESSKAYYTSSVPGLGLEKRDPSCTISSVGGKTASLSEAFVTITRTSATEWTIEAPAHEGRYRDDPISNAIDHGWFLMPFSMTVSCLDANDCPALPGQ